MARIRQEGPKNACLIYLDTFSQDTEQEGLPKPMGASTVIIL